MKKVVWSVCLVLAADMIRHLRAAQEPLEADCRQKTPSRLVGRYDGDELICQAPPPVARARHLEHRIGAHLPGSKQRAAASSEGHQTAKNKLNIAVPVYT